MAGGHINWPAIIIPGLIAAGIGGWVLVGMIRDGKGWRAALGMGLLFGLGFGIFYALTGLEAAYVPQLPWKLGDWQETISICVSALIALGICVGILKLWELVFGEIQFDKDEAPATDVEPQAPPAP